MRIRLLRLVAVLVALANVLLSMPATARAGGYCTSGNELTQAFPTSGPAVSTWHFCWDIVRMPNEEGDPLQSETLVITQAEFRPGAAAAPVAVIGDMRMSEIFVPYHSGDPRFHDLTDYPFDLQPLTTVECPSTRLSGDRICKEIVDRGLAWRDPFAFTARRGEKLVLWSILNAGNYDYVMHYEFFDDGTIEVRAAATGRKLLGADDDNGHMHNFAWRVNLDVAGPDGDAASITSLKTGGFAVNDKHKHVEREGGFPWEDKSFTHVEVEDATHQNGRGRATGYTLAPVREGLSRTPEPWMRYPIWVTRSHGPSSELRARDLPEYVRDREPVEGEDVVLWYVDAHNHENDMRDEDRDTVPAAWLGFRLEPQNLWDSTPFYDS